MARSSSCVLRVGGALPALASALAIASLLALPESSLADVRQPTGQVVPTEPGCNAGRPTGLLPLFSCICDRPGACNIGAVCPSETSCDEGRNATCESRMYHVFNDNTCIPSRHDGLDPRSDARTTPETFAPVCGLTFKLESRGTARFQNVFGWYNVTDSTPTPADLHPMLDCHAAPGVSVVLDVRSDPAYLGGEIGFFLATPESHEASGTCAGGDCCASIERLSRGEGYAYFSQASRNPDHRDSGSFVHLLVYDSVVWDRKFYFAWEDTFNAPNNDFTDLVTSVEGVECAGGGQPCETGRPGACSRGVTRCEGGELSCVPIFDGAPERCDGLDNDCDGTIDDEATCDDPSHVCHLGACVPRCEVGREFACPLEHDQCDPATGLCVEPACMGTSCEQGSVCRAGTCTRECEGIRCPHGLVCLLDQCLDPCDGAHCAVGQTCRQGVCVPGCNQCNGAMCESGQTCDESTGECRDTSCATACAPGSHCDGHGSCVDSCEGAVCPRGQQCRVGRCVPIPVEMRDAGVWIDPPMRDAGDVLLHGGPTSPSCACSVIARPKDEDDGASLAATGVLVSCASLLVARGRRRKNERQ